MKKRMANFELLRCIAMMMIVVLHFLGKGSLLDSLEGSVSTTGRAAWVLESFALVAVNIYMLLSGYFLCESNVKVSRLLNLLLQVWMYSIGVGLIGVLVGHPEVDLDTHYYLTILFPVSMGHYWYITAYVFLFLLLPFLGSAVKSMTEKQLRFSAFILLAAFSLVKTVLPVVLEMDEKGYDVLWYITLFVVAAYIRRFGISFLEKRGRGVVLYVVASLGVFAGSMIMNAVYLKTGHFKLVVAMFTHYNHILPFLSAVGLFYAFLHINIPDKLNGVLAAVGSCTLGVYLLHENIGVRYAWQSWLGAGNVTGIVSLILYTVAAAVIVFVVGILVELIRKSLVKIAGKVLSFLPIWRKWLSLLKKLDMVFEEKSVE